MNALPRFSSFSVDGVDFHDERSCDVGTRQAAQRVSVDVLLRKLQHDGDDRSNVTLCSASETNTQYATAAVKSHGDALQGEFDLADFKRQFRPVRADWEVDLKDTHLVGLVVTSPVEGSSDGVLGEIRGNVSLYNLLDLGNGEYSTMIAPAYDYGVENDGWERRYALLIKHLLLEGLVAVLPLPTEPSGVYPIKVATFTEFRFPQGNSGHRWWEGNVTDPVVEELQDIADIRFVTSASGDGKRWLYSLCPK